MVNANIGISLSKEDVLSNLHRLPVLPAVVQEVIASFNDDQLDRTVLACKISQDQGLTAKVLRVANSSFFGLSRKVSSVQDATIVIGLNGIRSLALAAGFVQSFPQTPDNQLDRREYWLRSLRVAGYTQAVAKCLKQDSQLAFTAGMFHDIGHLVLDICIPKEFASMLAKKKESGLSLTEIEQQNLGFDHALIGAEVAQRWNFPVEIEHAIRYWRTPEHEPFQISTGMVHVASLLESGLSGEDLINLLPTSLCDRLNLTWDRISDRLPESDQLEAEANLILDT